MQVRARSALIHAQWTPSEKRRIFHLILQCFGVVFFCVSERFETVFYFPPPARKGLIFIDTDTGFKTLATTKCVFVRAEKNKFQTRTEPEVPQSSKGSELYRRRSYFSFSWR